MEVMVSVTIFAIVITIGIGSLLTIYSTLRKTRADQQVMDSLSYVMDTMTRRIRTGTGYVSTGTGITFKDQQDENGGGDTITYESAPDDNGTLHLFSTSSVDGIRYDITPQNLKIDNFNIDINNDGQPLVQINLSGEIINGKKETPLSIQASVSQRAFVSSGSSLLLNNNQSQTLPTDPTNSTITLTPTTKPTTGSSTFNSLNNTPGGVRTPVTEVPVTAAQ